MVYGNNILAQKIQVGDKVNMHLYGWKVVKKVAHDFMTRVVFEDDMEASFQNSELVFTIRNVE